MKENDIEASMSFPLNNKVASILSMGVSQSELIPVYPETGDYSTSFSYQPLPSCQKKNIVKYKSKQNSVNRNGASSQSRSSPQRLP